MLAVTQAFLDALAQPHGRIARVTVLGPTLVPLAVITGEGGVATGGGISMKDSGDVRRTFSMTVANPGGAYTPADATDLFYFTNLVRIERGITVDGSEVYLAKGVYVIDEPDLEVTKAGSILSLQGRGRMAKASGSLFASPVTYPSGMAVADVIRDLLQDAGMGSDDALYALNDGGSALGADRSYDVGGGRLASAHALAADFALDLTEDDSGVVTLDPFVDPSTVAPVWTYAPSETGTMGGVKKQWKRDQMFNHVLVSGESAFQDPIVSEVRDLNSASPTYNPPPPGISTIGDFLYTYTSAQVTTQDQADRLAAKLLRKFAIRDEALQIPAIVNPALEVGDVIAVRESISVTDGKYVITQIDLPLGPGKMTVSVKPARPLDG